MVAASCGEDAPGPATSCSATSCSDQAHRRSAAPPPAGSSPRRWPCTGMRTNQVYGTPGRNVLGSCSWFIQSCLSPHPSSQHLTFRINLTLLVIVACNTEGTTKCRCHQWRPSRTISGYGAGNQPPPTPSADIARGPTPGHVLALSSATQVGQPPRSSRVNLLLFAPQRGARSRCHPLQAPRPDAAPPVVSADDSSIGGPLTSRPPPILQPLDAIALSQSLDPHVRRPVEGCVLGRTGIRLAAAP